jgi:hypothetical protein
MVSPRVVALNTCEERYMRLVDIRKRIHREIMLLMAAGSPFGKCCVELFMEVRMNL